MAFDIVSMVNLILSAAILGVAHWGYLRSGNKMLLYVSMAFGMFSLSHLLILAGLEAALTPVVIGLRLLGYLLMLFAVSLSLQGRK